MSEIKKSIEVLTDLLKINATGERYNLTRKQILAIFQAIKWGEAISEANEEIPKRPCNKQLAFDRGWLCFKKEITPIIEKKNIKIAELQEKILEMSYEAIAGGKKIEGLEEKLKEAQERIKELEKDILVKLKILKSSNDGTLYFQQQLQSLKDKLKDDSFAITFQSLGQYRTALLKETEVR